MMIIAFSPSYTNDGRTSGHSNFFSSRVLSYFSNYLLNNSEERRNGNTEQILAQKACLPMESALPLPPVKWCNVCLLPRKEQD